MDSTKIVFFSCFNVSGHINPMVSIANQLKADLGYRTIFFLPEPAVDDEIRAYGHELETFKSNPIVEQENTTEPDCTGDVFTRMLEEYNREPIDVAIQVSKKVCNQMIKSMVANIDIYEEAFRRIKPNLVIVDPSIIHPYLINSSYPPWVNVMACNPLPFCESKLPGKERVPPMMGCKLFHKTFREQMRKNDPDGWKALIASWDEKFKMLQEGVEVEDKFYTDRGCKPLKYCSSNHDSPHLNVLMMPRDIDYDLEDDILGYRPNFFACDSLIREPQMDSDDCKIWSERLKRAMVGKEAMIYFSLGTLVSCREYVQRFVDMFRMDKSRLYLINKGVHGDQVELDDENMLGANYLPQTFLLKHADLAIVHGGNNTMVECLSNGVPMITLPVCFDNFDNAQRIDDLKLGRRLNLHECNQQELMDCINQTLADKEIITRAKNIAKRMRDREDIRKISVILKKLVEEGKLDFEFLRECREKNFDQIEKSSS